MMEVGCSGAAPGTEQLAIIDGTTYSACYQKILKRNIYQFVKLKLRHS